MRSGIAKVQQAALAVRSKIAEPVSPEAEYVRYREMAENPDKLLGFVSHGMGTNDPAQIQQGAVDYLTAMKKRFGEV